MKRIYHIEHSRGSHIEHIGGFPVLCALCENNYVTYPALCGTSCGKKHNTYVVKKHPECPFSKPENS